MIRRGLIVSRRSVAQRALFAASKSAFSLKSTKSAANGAKRAFSMTSARMLPTHELVNLPALSPTMETGTIKQWEVSHKIFITELYYYLSSNLSKPAHFSNFVKMNVSKTIKLY